MPEWGMLPIPKKLVQQGVRDMVRLSDSRMSGTSYGACILHVSPESYIGGPLALVKTGDMISLDVDKRTIDMNVPDEELARRKAAWKQPEPRYERGYGWMFTRHIKQANEGCDFDFLETGFGAPSPNRRSTNSCRSAGLRPAHDHEAGRRPALRQKENTMALSASARDKLGTVSTPTVATALFKRGHRIQAIQTCTLCRPTSRPWSARPSPCATSRRARPQHARRVPRPQPSAAQGDRGLPAWRGAGDGQSQGRARRLGRRDPADTADEARRCRRGDRRRLPRFAEIAALGFPPITSARARRPT
jgi:hypothetical protein